MPVISRASIQNLKARIDIADVVSSVVSLKRAGSKFKGLSPFNQEKTPSFFVSPDKGLFKCFSSGKAGDVITFVMETERLAFNEAVEALSRRFNVPLEYESGGASNEERSLRQELFDLHEIAAEAFREGFLAKTPAGETIRAYWTENRRFAPETADDFKIGLALPDGGGLFDLLRKRGFTDPAIKQSGLFYVRQSGGVSPRFRGRLMIPIRDHQGRVVAFTARQLEMTPQDDPTREAKYVNSPETPIFIKGQLLFNLDRARLKAGKGNPFLMVEGQLDAIRCWTAGLETTIAPQGTGVTDTQLRLLRRYHAGLEVLLDGDAAGQGAALRILPLALQEGIEISFLPLTGKTDPDQLVLEQGAEAIARLRAHRLGAAAFAVSALMPRPAEMTAQLRAEACGQIFAIIQRNNSEIAQAEYLGEIATLTGVSRGALEADYRQFRESLARRASARTAYEESRPPNAPDKAPDGPPAPESTIFGGAENDLLLLIFHFEPVGQLLAQHVQHEWIDETTRSGRLLNQFLNDIAHDAWPAPEHLNEHLDEHIESHDDRSFIASLRFEAPLIEDPIRIANDGIRRMVSNFCTPKIRKIELEIAAKQRNFDADLLSLLKKAGELRRLKLNPPTILPPA